MIGGAVLGSRGRPHLPYTAESRSGRDDRQQAVGKKVRLLAQNHPASEFGLDDQICTLDNFIICCKVT
jgi:hypothetical protein